ncbi:MAG: adenosylcobinamide-phosphate synthase CbiB, partial [Chloroflexota bacterium]
MARARREPASADFVEVARGLILRWWLVPAVAVAADLLWGEPPARVHPVVWMGRLIAALERRAPDGSSARLLYGAGMVAACLVAFTVPAWLLEQTLRRCGPAGAVLLGVCLKPAFAVRELLRATARVQTALRNDDLASARAGLRSLVSRDTANLTAPLLAAAAIESVAENCSDSVVAPLLYYGLWGLPGAVAYRVINTLDAMVGYRNQRYEHLGKAAARIDDLANVVPARLTGLL